MARSMKPPDHLKSPCIPKVSMAYWWDISSEYLLDMGQQSLNPRRVSIESDSGMSIELNRSDTDLSQRAYDDGLFANNQRCIWILHWGMDFIPMIPRSMTLDPDGLLDIYGYPRNTLDVYGAMAISYEEKAPTDGLIVLNRVGVGMVRTNCQ